MQPLSSRKSDVQAAPYAIEPSRRRELRKLERSLRVRFRRVYLLDQALSHSSFVNELPAQTRAHYEKLEFLGYLPTPAEIRSEVEN